MSCEITYHDRKLTISVEGIFSYGMWIKFKDLEIDLSDIKECEVDFSKTVYIDSRGIGGLMVLKEKVGDQAKIILTNTNSNIHKIITTAQLTKIFEVS